ncbi:MAG: glycosyltransferase [Planctomycetes bacterium]|nr:glycosyltransferase [Planctomycetota bacterium]
MKVQVVTPWYPDRYSPYSGIFVKKQVDALRRLCHQVEVEVPVIYPAPQGAVPDAVARAMESLAEIDPAAMFAQDDGVTRVPAAVPSRSGDLGRAAAYENSMRIKRSFLPGEVDITHAHLGVPTGLALLHLGAKPLVVTEHQSTLGRVFGQPGGVEAYQEVLEGADAFICVSSHLKDQIVGATQSKAAEAIDIVPNIVDLSDIPFRERARGAHGHWVYVGTIATHKGIELLLRAFKVYRQGDRSATLTIVGVGPHRPWVERFTAGAGLSRSVRLTGSVPHEKIGAFLDKADVLVHLSPSETFGIASLEAIGAGLPVVSLRNGGAESAWGDFEEVVGCLLPAGASAVDVAEAVVRLEERGDALDPQAGRRMVEGRFAPNQIADALIATYERVL